MLHSRVLRCSLLYAIMLIAPAGCVDQTTGPSGRMPPYLAVLVFVDAPPEVTTRGPFTFRVRELSGTIGIDTTFRASPSDTTILSVSPATYRVDISGVPATCGVRNGSAQAMVVPPNSNTSLVRFFITCEPGLTIITGTDGATADPDYLVTITGADGAARTRVMASNDTARIPDLAAGTYDVSVRLVADNCVVTSDGGESVRATVLAARSTLVRFRIVCAEPAKRPRIVKLAATYRDGAIAYVIRAADPNGDVARSFVDVTDCNHRSVLPNGGFLRVGFAGAPNVARRDTAVIIGAYDLTLTDAQLAQRCIAVWVDDERGNVSPIIEQPLTPSVSARAPVLTSFTALLNGVRSVRVNATASDPNADYLGAFFVYLVRDGVLTVSDGQADRVLSLPAGVLGAVSSELAVGIGFGAWNDYLGVIMYVVDTEGNFTRAIDMDLSR